MADLPVMLRISGRRCVVVGGGAVAVRRAVSLAQAGAQVVVIAPNIDKRLVGLADIVEQRAYQRSDLDGAWLVVIATDNPKVNQAIADHAGAAGVLVNRADDPSEGDILIPAHEHHGPVTLSVYTGGASAAAAGTIRRELSAALDPDWPRFLEIIAPFRQAIRQQVADPKQRAQRLKRLGDERAMQVFKRDGHDALLAFCRSLLQA